MEIDFLIAFYLKKKKFKQLRRVICLEDRGPDFLGQNRKIVRWNDKIEKIQLSCEVNEKSSNLKI